MPPYPVEGKKGQVSIVIPVYNHAELLPRAIQSALTQTHSCEVIVVNDGSTDGSETAARKFEPKITVVSQPNRGLSAARNSGIAVARGEFLLFLDADDWLEPDAAERLRTAYAGLSPDFGVVASRAHQVDGNGTRVSQTRVDPWGEEEIEVTWTDLLISGRRTRFPCSALVKREIFERCGGFDEAFGRLGSEDRDMWLRVASSGFRIRRLPLRLLNVAVHGGNMSSDPSRQLPGMHRCLAKARKSGQMPLWRLDVWGKVYSHYFLQASRMHRDRGNRRRSLLNGFLSLAVYPLPGLSARLGYEPGCRLKTFLVSIRDLPRPKREKESPEVSKNSA